MKNIFRNLKTKTDRVFWHNIDLVAKEVTIWPISTKATVVFQENDDDQQS